MIELLLAVVLGAGATAVAGALAHGARAVYHDGLRPIVRDAAPHGPERRALAGDAWAMSAGFIAWYALPTTLLTGVVISHLLFLPADVLGVRLAKRGSVLIAAALVGAGVMLAVAVVRTFGPPLLPALVPATAAFAAVVVQLVPLIPPAAAARLGGWPLALVSAAFAALGWLLAAPAGGDRVALAIVVGCLPLGWHLARSRVIAAPDLDFSEQTGRVRDSLAGLLLFAALAGGLAGLLLIAGEPLAAWLLAAGRPAAAAAVALVTAAAFLPLVVTSSMTSGVYSTQGYPDWVFAPGYLSAAVAPAVRVAGTPSAVSPLGSVAGAGVGAVGAALLMAVEGLGLRWLAAWLVRHPELATLGAALRSAMTDVLNVAALLGGLAGSLAVAPAYGPLVVGGAVVANELAGRRVPPYGLGPAALLVVVVLARLTEALS